jgi:hypothetical protein
MIITAIDPGQTTGWAIYSAESIEIPFDDQLHSEWHNERYNEKWSCGQFGPHDHHEELMNWSPRSGVWMLYGSGRSRV